MTGSDKKEKNGHINISTPLISCRSRGSRHNHTPLPMTEKQPFLSDSNPVTEPSPRLERDDLQSAAFLAKSLSDGNRLRILLLLSDGRKSVSALVEKLNLSQPLVSHHLKELKRSLLVTVEREGPFIYYQLADTRILVVIEALNQVAANLLATRTTF